MSRHADITRLLLDVILLDGEQDEAPSLSDMARRARELLSGYVAVKAPAIGQREERITAWLEALAHALNRRITDAEAGRLRSAFFFGWNDGYDVGAETARRAVTEETCRTLSGLVDVWRGPVKESP